MAWAWGTTENVKSTKVEQEIAIPDEPHVEQFDPHSGEWLLNKFETYNQLRQFETAYWSRKYQMYVITRYDDVVFVLGNPEIFSSDQGNLIVENAYSTDNIQRITDAFVERCKEVIKPIDNLNISSIIQDLSAAVTAEIINPPFKKAEIEQYVKHIQQYHTGCVKYNIDDTGYNMFVDLLMSMSTELQVPPTGPGIYSELVTNNTEKTHLLSTFAEPAISWASSLTGALEILTLDLFSENKLDIILADRSLIPNLVNESMRFHASTGRLSRTVTQNITLHGVNLEPGTRVAICLESANRDPAMFPEPNKFLLGRNTNAHVAVGHSVLAKNLMQAWVEQLLDLYGRYKVLTDNKDLAYVITATGNNNMISNIYLSTDK